MKPRRNKTRQLKDFINKTEMGIILKVRKSKTISKHTGEPCIQVPDRLAFGLDSGRWLDELCNDTIFDNKGYGYCYSALNLYELCEIADNIK